MTKLSEIFLEKSIRLDVSVSDYASAISAAGDLLVSSGHTKTSYTNSMIRVVDELGPYIVIAEGIALAHATPNEDVHSTGLSLVRTSAPVDFGSGKLVSLVFALAALNHDDHIEAMGELASVLADVENVNWLLNEASTEQIHSKLTFGLGE